MRDSVYWYMSAKIDEEPPATYIRTLMINTAGPSAILNRYQTTRYQIPDSDVHITLRETNVTYPPIVCEVYPVIYQLRCCMYVLGRSQWPHSLRRGSAAARWLILRNWTPRRKCTSVCCECCVLSARGLCVGVITRSGVLPSVVCLTECDCEAWIHGKPWPEYAPKYHREKKIHIMGEWQSKAAALQVMLKIDCKMFICNYKFYLWHT
jgi:hypothetical protein